MLALLCLIGIVGLASISKITDKEDEKLIAGNFVKINDGKGHQFRINAFNKHSNLSIWIMVLFVLGFSYCLYNTVNNAIKEVSKDFGIFILCVGLVMGLLSLLLLHKVLKDMKIRIKIKHYFGVFCNLFGLSLIFSWWGYWFFKLAF